MADPANVLLPCKSAALQGEKGRQDSPKEEADTANTA